MLLSIRENDCRSICKCKQRILVYSPKYDNILHSKAMEIVLSQLIIRERGKEKVWGQQQDLGWGASAPLPLPRNATAVCFSNNDKVKATGSNETISKLINVRDHD